MRINHRSFLLLALVTASFFQSLRTLDAAPISFTIDSTRSLLSMSASGITGSLDNPKDEKHLLPQSFLPFTTQNVPDSLSARLNGFLNADFDRVAGTLEFLETQLNYQNSGSYRPNGSLAQARQPAVYGGVVNYPFNPVFERVEITQRDMVSTIQGPSLALAGAAGGWLFDPSLLEMNFGGVASFYFEGRPFFNYTSPLAEQVFFANQATQEGSLFVADGLMTLSIPTRVMLYTQFAFPGSTDEVYQLLTYEGMIVATAVVPEAGSLVLLGLTGMATSWCLYRRRAKPRAVQGHENGCAPDART